MDTLYPFIETIRLENGRFCLADYHIGRMRRTCAETYGTDAPPLDLTGDSVPPRFRTGTVKCRVRYGRDIGCVEFEAYSPRAVRSLRMVDAGQLDYHLKYADRSALEALDRLRGGADGILIVRDGLVTDTGYSNIVCVAGDRLLTPRTPLLHGVMRAWMLDTGLAEEADITPGMLRPASGSGITRVCMVNAMLPPGQGPSISPDLIF